jgi:esterase
VFVPSHHIVQAPGATPTGTVFALHGILGSGRNLRTLATRLCQAAPLLRVVLVDLRCHGDSHGAPPPHTLRACADDLRTLARHLDTQPVAVLGHSFGGKVALVYAGMHPEELRQVWVLDATPDAGRQGDDATDALGVAEVVDLLEDVPLPLPSREALVTELLTRGASPAVAQWMTTNVHAMAGGLTWKFDLPAVRELLASYFATDVWPVLEQPPPGVELHLVLAAREPRWTSQILHRLSQLPSSVQVHSLDAGHWLHVDDLPGLIALMGPYLRTL